MSAASFISDMNALQKEFDALPLEVTRLIGSLMELVEVQQSNIGTLLVANKKLLGVIDELKG
ncbi:hypothetical protein SAMN05518669_103369 [Variovorax sp. YR634]|uniref:hypothetical protein n=1 Tax=Variovorax sp. YR634 TaxID=1884385 RepID=UPI00089CFD15|nr:hypothetical protein [Variovorax sp. YR634]SDX13482.1 hypothetical protein SAMN05518669_103369 [Variovorax sp. YR634]